MLIATICFDFEGKHCHHDKEVPPDMFPASQLKILMDRGWIIDNTPPPKPKPVRHAKVVESVESELDDESEAVEDEAVEPEVVEPKSVKPKKLRLRRGSSDMGDI